MGLIVRCLTHDSEVSSSSPGLARLPSDTKHVIDLFSSLNELKTQAFKNLKKKSRFQIPNHSSLVMFQFIFYFYKYTLRFQNIAKYRQNDIF